MISKILKTRLAKRDPYCVHCGETNDLVIHHRKNRQMGGSKLLDHYTNLLMVCEQYNFEMESNSKIAQEARQWGHKLQSWQDFSEPVLDTITGFWWVLQDDGTRERLPNKNEGLF